MKYDLVILGSGESGTGAALLAHKCGLNVFVSDKAPIAEIYKKELLQYSIPYEEGYHTEDIILQAKEIIKSPGIPSQIPLIEKIKEKDIPVMSEIEFAYRYKGESKILAITGSNGKTTTTSLCYHIFKGASYDVSVVGNIGFSFARQIAEKPTQWYVMEISSFQLDDIITFKPDIAIITNITPDHLDRYQYNFDLYVQAKFRIAMNQSQDDILILCKDDNATQQYLQQHILNPKIIYFTMNEQLQQGGAFVSKDQLIFNINGEPFSIDINELSLKGKHNQYNSMAAGISARAAEIRNATIRDCIKSFTSIEHRLESVAFIRGIEFINDSKATNLNSVWYALESVQKPTILIMGGVDKGNNYDEIKDLVKEKVKAIVCLGRDNKAITQAFEKLVPVYETTEMEDAVNTSYKLATQGDIVLLSPACASFDLFKNFEDRGQQFTKAVKNL